MHVAVEVGRGHWIPASYLGPPKADEDTMRRSVIPILIAFVALATAGHGQLVAQSSSPAVARLSLAGPAKRYCSGIWVSERNRQEALYNSVLLGEELVEEYESGHLTFGIDDERRIVTASGTASQPARVTSGTRVA